jgi:prepilin-type N-terminal cleavage/methylation domain-containing protein
MKPIKAAFSLMEVMIVLAILALLASFAVPRYQNYLDKGKYKTSQLNLKMVAEAFEHYHSEHGAYPIFNSWTDLSSEKSVLLEFLTEVPATDKWNRPYDVRSNQKEYRLAGQGIPNGKLAGTYPDYVFLPGPLLRLGAAAHGTAPGSAEPALP